MNRITFLNIFIRILVVMVCAVGVSSLLLQHVLRVDAETCKELIANECAELRWEKAPAPLGEVAEIAISPINPDVMYAGIEVNSHSLYTSTDGGKTWRRIDGGGDHTKDVAVSPKDPKKVYFAMSDTIQSTNVSIAPMVRSQTSHTRHGGETAEIFSFGRLAVSGGLLSTLEVFDQDDNVIYAAMTGGSSGPRITSKPIIFKTIDSGNNWTKIEPSLNDINVIEINPTNHESIYIGTGDGLYLSKDSGKTVEKLKATGSFGGFISVEIQKDNPRIVYIASGTEVFKSEDAGKTWQDVKGVLSNIHRVRISRSHPNVLYASTFNGVFRSNDYGRTWTNKTSNLKGKNIQIVTIHPQNPDIAFIGHSSLWSSVRASRRYKHALWAENGIFKTIDGGNSWFRSDEGMYEYTLEEVAVSPHRPNEAWVTAPASVGGHKTIDAAHHWLLTQIHTLHYPMRIKYSMQDPDKIYTTSWHPGGPFALSMDGGASWKTTNEEEFFKGINRGRNLYRVGAGQQIQPIHLHGLAVDPHDDTIVYAGSVHDPIIPGEQLLEGSHIWKSRDTGKTWQESDEGFPHEKHTAIHDMHIDPKNTNIVYVATTEHEAKIGMGIYKSIDAGKTWQAINNGLHNLSIGAVAIHPENTSLLLAATHSGLYKSNNSGQSWIQTSSSHAFDVEYVQHEPHVVYASTDDGVLTSKDFGDTWYKVNYGLPKGEGQGIGVSIDGNVIYTAVKWQGVYVARIKPVALKEPVSSVTQRGFEFTFNIGRTEPDTRMESGTRMVNEPRPSPSNFLRREIEFTRTLKKGMSGDDVKELQIFFKQLPHVYPEGSVTGYFGVLTEKAVKKFQATYGIEQIGIVGPKTRATLHSLRSPQIPREQQQKLPAKNDLFLIQEACMKKPLVPLGGYQELLTDAHVHTMPRDDPSTFALQLLQEMNENGADRIVIQPNHSPTTVLENSLLDRAWGEIAAVCPRIIPLVYGFNPANKDAWLYVKERLDTGNYGGVGEIEFRHGNMDIKQDPESEGMLKIYDLLEQKESALSFQASLWKDPGLEEKMYRIISARPKMNFIWFGGCPISERFMALSNLHCSFFVNTKNNLPRKEDFKRSLIGTDSGPAGFWNGGGLLPYNSFGEGMQEARKIFTTMQKEDADMLAHKNFDTIWSR